MYFSRACCRGATSCAPALISTPTFLTSEINSTQNQQRWRKELGIKKEKVDAAYAFMQWCDRLSLILCQQELPDDERFLEISKGPEGERYDIMQRSDRLVVVKPWPFQEHKFTVNVEACDLSQVKFQSSAELTQALQKAPIKLLEWTFIKS